MTEKEAIDQALRTERRISRRQQLLRKLWRLNQAETETETATVSRNVKTESIPDDKAKVPQDTRKSERDATLA